MSNNVWSDFVDWGLQSAGPITHHAKPSRRVATKQRAAEEFYDSAREGRGRLRTLGGLTGFLGGVSIFAYLGIQRCINFASDKPVVFKPVASQAQAAMEAPASNGTATVLVLGALVSAFGVVKFWQGVHEASVARDRDGADDSGSFEDVFALGAYDYEDDKPWIDRFDDRHRYAA